MRESEEQIENSGLNTEFFFILRIRIDSLNCRC